MGITTGLTNYLCSKNSFGTKNRNVTSILILLLWLVVVTVVSKNHEVLRDEVRALTIALEPTLLWHLPSVIRNEGHPILWFLIIRMASSVLHAPVILKIISICIGFGGVVIFYSSAPFVTWQKLLFIGGKLPIYTYSVMSRNYGISMFLFFLFATLFSQEKKRPFLIAFVLALLANTNVHSCILVGMLAAVWLFNEIVVDRASVTLQGALVLAGAHALVAIGMFYSVATTLPTPQSIIASGLPSASEVNEAFWINIQHPGMHLDAIFPRLSGPMRDVLIWMLIAGLLARPAEAISLYVGVVVVGVLFSTVYPGAPRHQGLILIFVITLYWIVFKRLAKSAKGMWSARGRILFRTSLYIVLSAILAAHVIQSVRAIENEIREDMSASAAFGEFLRAHPEFHDAIILGEPDFRLESLPFYVSNRIYIPRERRFGNRVMFTRSSKARMSLDELLNIAHQIRNEQGSPVLIALGHFDLSGQESHEIRYPYGKVFTWSVEDLARFEFETVMVAEFKEARTDENYEIYLLH